jgi:RNA polymerase sigma factor (sigma-70 family)
MATSPISVVIQRLRTAFGQDGAGMTDGELLTLFLDSRDEAPLAALVRRHASMVWGVCRRLLRSHHDAEDAFQATFLVLVRKADSVKPREAVSNWLYGVAYQTAVRVRALAAKRGGRERQVTDMPEPVVPDASSDDLFSLLDQELNRLPDKHRLVIVLGDLEGKTRTELAQQLGVSEGTVAGRLARAREMLAKRLARRGLAISGGALAAALAQSAASASAPAPLVASTIQAASLVAVGQAASAGLVSANVVPLTEGVMRAMFVSKIKSVLAVVLVATVVLGGVGISYGLLSGSKPVAEKRTNMSVTSAPLPQEDAKPAKPEVFTGTIIKDAHAAAAVLGRHGVLFMRSEARWDEWKMRAPNLTLDKPLPKIDFARQSVVVLYALGMLNRFDLDLVESNFNANSPQLGFSLRWDTRPAEDGKPATVIRLIYAVIPAKPVVNVTVTSSPTQADRDRTVTEFSALLGGKDGGDIVDGLQATITPKATTLKPGDDILIDFALHLADFGKAKPEHFGTTPTNVFVWDGKYSNGYRNHAFFVTTPDGKTTLLRPKEILAWDKNAPHPVEISAKEPYHLPNWAEGDTRKSLKALGLDTATAGTYTITGLYEENAQAADNRQGGKTQLWGGSIISNTITVEVEAVADPK